MINIKRDLPEYRLCTSCRSNNNVYEIEISYTAGNVTQGTAVALCENCRNELINKIRKFDILVMSEDN